MKKTKCSNCGDIIYFDWYTISGIDDVEKEFKLYQGETTVGVGKFIGIGNMSKEVCNRCCLHGVKRYVKT